MNAEMSGWIIKWLNECWNGWKNAEMSGWMLK